MQGIPTAAEIWRDYEGTRLWRLPGSEAYFYLTERMAIDADGAPNAYHPNNTGIDYLANAGYPNGGWRSVLAEDPNHPSQPYVQSSGEFAGYFIAKTTLQDHPARPPCKTTLQDKARSATDPKRYVNSRQVPYLVFPGAFYAIRGTGDFGDLALAHNLDNGKKSPAIVADAGPQNAKLGEVSIRLAENLGGRNVNPRNGAGVPPGRFLYTVFPKSKQQPAWPLTPDRLETLVEDLIGAIGGWEQIVAGL